MKKLLLVLLFVPLVSFGQSPYIKAYGETAKAYYMEGKNTRDFGEKIKLFSKSIELDSLYSNSAYYHRAYAKKIMGDTEGALADYTKVAEGNGIYKCNAYLWSAGLWEGLKDFEGAIADYTKAIECSPYSKIAYYERGQVNSILGNNEDACVDYKKALSIVDNTIEDIEEFQQEIKEAAKNCY